MKLINRIIMLNVLISYVVALIAPISVKGKISEMDINHLLILIWVGFTLLSSLFIWVYFLYHWGTNNFKKRIFKPIWFAVIFFGVGLYFIGPVIYYIIVVEMRKTLLVQQEK